MTGPIAVGVESTPKKVFASALEWPGWSRAGRDEEAAVTALAATADRFAAVAHLAGVALGSIGLADLAVRERLPGTPTTAFGAPAVAFAADRRPTDAADGERLAAFARSAWAVLDRAVAAAPAELRKGPRGGGRDRDAMFAHVIAAESAYAAGVGLRFREPKPGDVAAIAAMRAALLEVLARPTDGAPVPGGRWPARYAARRITWHALDHAWEMEDRSGPK